MDRSEPPTVNGKGDSSGDSLFAPAARSSAGTAVPGVFIVKRYRLLYVDSGCEALSGYTREELFNRDVRELLHPDFREIPQLDILREGPGVGRSQAYESKVLTKSGRERWVAGELARIASDGERAILGTAFDVTGEKRAEEYARAGSVVLRQIFEEAPLGMALVGPDLRFLCVNRVLCEMLAYEAEELAGRMVTEVVHPVDAPASLASAQALVAGTLFRVRAERRYLRKDGSPVWLAVTAGSLRDENGEPICGLAMFEDVTYRRRTEAGERRYARMLLTTIEQERSRIARELHDDIGQSLAVVGMQLRVLQRNVGRDEQVGEGIQEAARRVEETARAVAELAHHYHPADLRNLGLSVALRAFARQWSRRQALAVALEVEQLGGLLTSDQELHVYRIVQEAFNNIAKHARATRARLSARGKDGSLVVTVEDDGVGMGPLEQPVEARGLGLTTMRERAAMAGGAFSIDRGCNGGCRVSVAIPLPERPTPRARP